MFTCMHQSSFVQLVEAAQDVDIQIMSAHSQVTYLIENINHLDHDLHKAIIVIQLDQGEMKSNFELAITYLFSVDLYNKQKKNQSPTILDANVLQNKSHR